MDRYFRKRARFRRERCGCGGEWGSVNFLEQYLKDAIQEIPCPTRFESSLESKCVSCRSITSTRAQGMRCEFCDAVFCQTRKREKLIPISPPLHFTCKAHSFEVNANNCANCGTKHDSHSRECEMCNTSYCVTCKKIKMKKVGSHISSWVRTHTRFKNYHQTHHRWGKKLGNVSNVSSVRRRKLRNVTVRTRRQATRM